MAILETKSREINGVRYEVEPLGFVAGRKAFVRLANLLGPALGSFDAAPKGVDGKVTEADAGAALTKAIGGLLATIRDEDLIYFQDLFSKRTTVHLADGKSPVLAGVLEEHFTGNLGAYFSWLAFAIEATYADFFGDAWRKIAGALPGKRAAKP
jgi:hypothetical protein